MRNESSVPVSPARLLCAVALLLCMVAFIWGNSLLDMTASGLRSQQVAEFLVRVLGKVLPRDHWALYYIRAHVRKIAHVVEFFALGAGAVLFFTVLRRVNLRTLCVSLLLVLVVAAIDETIQRYTGRGNSLRDVALDFSGGLAGVAGVAVLGACFRTRRKRR